MQYKNPELDALWEAGVGEVDQEKRGRRSTSKRSRSCATTWPTCRSSSTSSSKGTKAGLENYKQNAFVVSNMWNVFEWYWE